MSELVSLASHHILLKRLMRYAGDKGIQTKHNTAVENLQPGRAILELHSTHAATPAQNHDIESDGDSLVSLEGRGLEVLSIAEMSTHSRSGSSIPRDFSQQHSPKPKPLLTSRADTPMLGAQARAAELAAASAAKQRQVSRELEEQQLPPKPAVSLSAFSKPQMPVSRNKGTKVWKTLTLDDIVESTDSRPSSGLDFSNPSHADRLNTQDVSEKKIPIAPRAMMTDFSLSTVGSRPPPVENSAVSLISAQQREPSSQVPARFLAYQVNASAAISLEDSTRSHSFGSMVLGSETTPRKQDEQFSMLENVPLPLFVHSRGVPHFVTSQNSTVPPVETLSYGAPPTMGQGQEYTSCNSGGERYHHGFQVPLTNQATSAMRPHEVGPDNGQTEITGQVGSIQEKDSTVSRIELAANRLPRLPDCQAAYQQSQSESHLADQTPYDTEQAMKECVSKLKERARDGKTVLHNPLNHEDPPQRRGSEFQSFLGTQLNGSSNSQAPVPWVVQPKDSMRPSEWEATPLSADITLTRVKPGCRDQIGSSATNRVPRPPISGIPVPSDSSNYTKRNVRSALHAPEIGTIEWMRLVPITTAERKQVRRCMASAAKSITNETMDINIRRGNQIEDINKSQGWFYTDPRGEKLLREQVDLGAQAHAGKVIADLEARHGGSLPKDFKRGKDDGLGATLILGNIACNLQTYLVGDRKSIEQKRNFHRVKSVPDWCTERGSLSIGAPSGGDSYFDGAAGGFYGAPVRVARDPRFRPQVKDGTKVKPEEEWKNRHEMYGRRIM